MKSIIIAAAVLGSIMTAGQNSSVGAERIEFRANLAFVKLPNSITLGACSGVDVNSKGNVYLFHRGKQPIICLDPNGKFIRAWGDDTDRKSVG